MARNHPDYVEVRLREDGDAPEVVARRLLELADDPHHVQMYPTPDVPHGVVFEVHADVATRFTQQGRGKGRGKAGADQ